MPDECRRLCHRGCRLAAGHRARAMERPAGAAGRGDAVHAPRIPGGDARKRQCRCANRMDCHVSPRCGPRPMRPVPDRARWWRSVRCISRTIPTANMCSTTPGRTPTASTDCPTTPRRWWRRRSRRFPVPGCWRATPRRAALLVQGLVRWCEQSGLSSLHLLFASDADVAACREAGLMLRHNVQFHWTNSIARYRDFDDFLASLNQDKRKKIRQERRKVRQAGVVFRHARGRCHHGRRTGTSSTAATSAPTTNTATHPI